MILSGFIIQNLQFKILLNFSYFFDILRKKCTFGNIYKKSQKKIQKFSKAEIMNQSDLLFFQEKITQVRYELASYLDERKIMLTSEQLFEMMTAAPVAMAIALDGKVDTLEQSVLEHTANFAHRYVDEQTSAETQELIAALTSPDDAVGYRDFPKVLEGELKFIAENFTNWKTPLLSGLKIFLELDEVVKKYNPFLKSLKAALIENMYTVMLKNFGDDEVEKVHLKEILDKLGINLEQENIDKIISSLS